MAPIPTSDTSYPAHWVADPTPVAWAEQYRSVCGVLVTTQTGLDSEYGPPRPPCEECAERAGWPYPGGADG